MTRVEEIVGAKQRRDSTDSSAQDASGGQGPADQKGPATTALTTMDELQASSSTNWDDLGKKLVEARKALDAATEADKLAGAELFAAQQKKAGTLRALQSASQRVKQLVAEFTALKPGLIGLTEQEPITASPTGSHYTRSTLPISDVAPIRPTPMLARPFRRSGGEDSAYGTRLSTQSAGAFTRSSSKDFDPFFPSSSAAKRTRFSEDGGDFKSRPQTSGSDTGEEDDHEAASEEHTSERERTSPTSSAKRKKNAYGHSIYRGVRKILSTGQYEVRISAGGKDMFLGRFDTEEEAARKYDEKARTLHRDKAVLNFITEQDIEMGCKSAVELATTRPAIKRT